MVQIWEPILGALTRDFRLLHVRRDPYLNDLFRSEIQKLAEEVSFKNTDAVVERLLSRRLPDRVKKTLELDADVVSNMDQILAGRNIPRDSFVNCVLFFLLAKTNHLNALGIEFDTDSKNEGKPLDEVRAFLLDPFWHIRSANNGSFYTLVPFPDSSWGRFPNLFSLNTAISEDEWFLLNVNYDELLDDLTLVK